MQDHDNKIHLELTPYTALAILSFCSALVTPEHANIPHLSGILNAVQEYADEVQNKITHAHIDDANSQKLLNQLLNKQP